MKLRNKNESSITELAIHFNIRVWTGVAILLSIALILEVIL